MDAAAISLSRENKLPILVFNIHAPGAFRRGDAGRGRVHPDYRKRLRGYDVMAADFDDLSLDLMRRMDGALDALKREFGGLRTGRASPALLDPVKVEAYGSLMPINQVATVAVPEARMITVQVWDRSMVNSVVAAIRDCGLGLNPQPDGQLVRVPLPILTEERRNELAKTAGEICRACPHCGARRAARRHGADQELAEKARNQRG